MTARVALISNTAWYLYNFRRGLIRELQRQGYAVLAIAPPDKYAAQLAELGATFHALPMDNQGTNPLKDLGMQLALRRLLRREQPSCVLTFTAKPNIYGAFAARATGIPAIANVSGLGSVFIRRSWITLVVHLLYRRALQSVATVFFQNPDDRALFVHKRLVDSAKSRLLPGSGVDVQWFAPRAQIRRSSDRFRFLLLGRLLWDKGVGEFVEAAARVRRRFPRCEIVLMGFTEADNPTAIPLSTIREWESGGLITFIPPAADVRAQLAQAQCVVLPSYREGTPKALLEASSMAIPVIATDVPGCRQVVEDGATGYLVRVRDAQDLAEKMERMLCLPDAEREAMGGRAREKMVREFDERIVIDAYLRAIRERI